MTASRLRSRARPAVRLRPVPPLDPPFDDERPSSAWPDAIGGQLALDLSGLARPGRSPLSRPAMPTAPPGRTGQTRPGGPEAPSRSGGSPALPPGAFATATPEAGQAARRFLTICLEIFNGYRTVSHIRGVCRPADAPVIVGHLGQAVDRLVGPPPRPRRAPRPVRPRRLRVCEPRPGVVEAAAVLETAERSWALPFRLERRGGSWLGVTVRLL